MALIHGADGFGYFCHSFIPPADDAALLHDPVMIRAVKAINQQVTELAPVLNCPDTKGYASVKSSNTSVPVDIMTKTFDNATYIFAVAMRSAFTTATFKIAGGGIAEVIGEDRIITITNGEFSDEFLPYGVHLYKIKM
jgi:hypothetical protein